MCKKNSVTAVVLCFLCAIQSSGQAKQLNPKSTLVAHERFKMDRSDLPRGHSGFAIAPDGKTFAVGNAMDGTVTLYSTADKKPIKKWKAHDNETHLLLFHPTLPRLLTGGGRNTTLARELKQWNLETGAEMWKILADSLHISAATYSKVGTFVATVSAERQGDFAKVWSAETGELRHSVLSKKDQLVSVDLSADAKRLLVCFRSNKLLAELCYRSSENPFIS